MITLLKPVRSAIPSTFASCSAAEAAAPWPDGAGRASPARGSRRSAPCPARPAPTPLPHQRELHGSSVAPISAMPAPISASPITTSLRRRARARAGPGSTIRRSTSSSRRSAPARRLFGGLAAHGGSAPAARGVHARRTPGSAAPSSRSRPAGRARCAQRPLREQPAQRGQPKHHADQRDCDCERRRAQAKPGDQQRRADGQPHRICGRICAQSRGAPLPLPSRRIAGVARIAAMGGSGASARNTQRQPRWSSTRPASAGPTSPCTTHAPRLPPACAA